ncbi:hypothetical protein KAR91_56535 [Candidatus Pacearchaeota archaeon]|nr:hypothetical protein [Candidatus Pacearchaeota archaeon]
MADHKILTELDWWGRCDYCHWPLKEIIEEGCVVSNCSMRPRPKLDADGELKQIIRRLNEENKQWEKSASMACENPCGDCAGCNIAEAECG